MMIETAILKNVEKLPESVKQAVLDYTEFLVNQYAPESPKTEKLPSEADWEFGKVQSGCLMILTNLLKI